MPEDAIGHPGGWRTQVIFTEDGEDYTTKIIEFDVGGHLLDNKKPAIVDIENWNSFIKHAGELIDDWEQLEEIRQTNEQQRELAESVRVSNEEERIANEQARVLSAAERYVEIVEILVGVDRGTQTTAGEANRALSNYMKTTNESWVVLNGR